MRVDRQTSMRLFPNCLWLGVMFCVSCAPAEVPRPDISQQPNVAATPSTIDSTIQRIDSSGLSTTGVAPIDSSPLNTLRDSLSVPGNPEPKVPIVFADVCPGEGCTFGTWIACRSISLRSEPRTGAPVAFIVHPKDSLVAVTGNEIVERAGKIIFRDTTRVSADGQRYLFTPADTLYPLVYSGELEGSWFFHGRLGYGYWFFHEFDGPQTDPNVVMVRERVTHWWVKAKHRQGDEGWFEFESGIAVDPEGHYEDSCPSQQ
jgi:hypothetical protein